MSNRSPAAFFSYVHADDEDDNGTISRLHAALQAEARMQTGADFPIFIDRDDIAWGQGWQQRIDDSLDGASLLIPVVTPAYFLSPACRSELERFLERERQLGRDDLIWPIYYVTTPALNAPEGDELAQVVASRQYTDWRQLRFEPLTSPVVRQRLAAVAENLQNTTRGLPSGATGGTAAAAPVKASRPPIEPPTLVVDPMGRGDHMTIGTAISAAEAGHRILILPGYYEEGLVLEKPLELIGQGPLEDIIVAAKDADAILFRTNIGRVTNLTLRHVGGGEWFGVDITQGRLELEGCDITSDGLACVAVRAGADPRVRRNRIHDSTQGGVFVLDQALGTFEDNEITSNALSGVEIKDGANPTFRRNRIGSNVECGVFVQDRGQGNFEDNDIVDNSEAGVGISTGGRPTLRRNRIHRNQYEAIWIYDGGGGTIEGNDLRDNARGAWDVAEASEENVVRSGNLESDEE